MPTVSTANTRPGYFRAKLLSQALLVLALIAPVMMLVGCGDDDDTFEGADVFELQNTLWSFADLRAFNLVNQSGVLNIQAFGSSALEDDEAPFILTLDPGQANTGEASGSVDLDEGDNPVGQDFSRCLFEVDTSTIAPPALGLTNGDTNNMDCIVSADGSELQLTNLNTNQISTGTLQAP